ncbi:MAG: hypothetical protein LC808_44490, partial [Actinobacteria bacterium]|nr:hypothetical protein [Actinomycetota bacterium]
SPFGWDASKFNTYGSDNYNDDGYHEMIERKSTTGSSTDPYASQRLYDQANIAILIDSLNVVKVYTGTGPTKTLVSSSSGSGLAPTAYQASLTSVIPGSYIQDNREQATGGVRVVNFDVAEFMKKFPNSNTEGWNGIVYISDTSASSSAKRAIRVRNGAKVPDGGITVVSNNPVYIQGDFNTGRVAGSSEPPSNTGDPADPEAGSYTREPASIMADAITLLSNNWSDANAATLAARKASNTTVNAALVAGNVPSNGTDYSGGGENFVRFAEDWTGKTFTYYGSMMCLYASTQGTGPWGNDNVYAPPQLQWYFDSKLSVDANGDPVKVPGYVSTVAYLQQQRWYLQY